MTAEPYDEWTVHHLYRAVFCESFYVFVNFTGAGGSNSPSGGNSVIARNDESPAGDKTFPWCYFDRDAILHAFKRVVNSPVVLGIAGFGRRTGPMGIGLMVVVAVWGVFRTLSQRVIPD
jgi:hypothetical protein